MPSSAIPVKSSAVPTPFAVDGHAERRFLDWLTSDALPDRLTTCPDGAPEATSTLLGTLITSSRPLTRCEAARVGSPPGTPLGVVATELIDAVHDPRGPRCRSFRAAVYYLRDHHELAPVLEEL